MNTIIFVSMLLLTAPAPTIPPTRVISLEQVLSYALKHNRTLKSATLSIEKQRAALDGAHGQFDTSLSATASGAQISASKIPGEFMSVTRQRAFTFEAGAQKMLRSGGIVSLSAKVERAEQLTELDMSSLAPGAAPQETKLESYSSSISVSVTHPLLRGMGLEVTQANITLATLGVEVEKIKRESGWQSTVRDIIVAYHNLHLLWKQYGVMQEGLKVAQSQLSQTQALVSANRATKSDLLAARSAVAQREVNLISARSGILKATLQLKMYMGMKVTQGESYFRPSAIKRAPEKKYSDALIKLALQRSLELKMTQKQIRMLEVQRKVANDALKPRLDLFLSAGPKGRSGSLGDSLMSMVTFDGFTVTGGLSLSFSPANTIARANLASINASKKIARLAKSDIGESVSMATLIALDAYRSAVQSVTAARLAVTLATTHLNHEQQKFAVGKGTNHSVLLRLEELERARMSLISAQNGVHIAVVQLETLAGRILKAYGLRLK